MISELKSLSWSIDRIRETDNLDKGDVEECLGEVLEILLKMNKARMITYPYCRDYDIIPEEEVTDDVKVEQ